MYHSRFAHFINPQSIDTIRASSQCLDYRRTSAQHIIDLYNLVSGILGVLREVRRVDSDKHHNQPLPQNPGGEDCKRKYFEQKR